MKSKTHQGVLDYWAKLFKATTWYGLKMIAQENENLKEASEALYTLNADDIIRQQCRTREGYHRTERKQELKIEALTEENATLTKEKNIYIDTK